MPYRDPTSPRARLAHKLRDGAYRARLLGVRVGLVTIAQAEASGLLAAERCHYCGIKLDGLYALEHKTPLIRGGAHELDNLTKSCQPCNQEKHIQEELEYLAFLDQAS